MRRLELPLLLLSLVAVLLAARFAAFQIGHIRRSPVQKFFVELTTAQSENSQVSLAIESQFFGYTKADRVWLFDDATMRWKPIQSPLGFDWWHAAVGTNLVNGELAIRGGSPALGFSVICKFDFEKEVARLCYQASEGASILPGIMLGTGDLLLFERWGDGRCSLVLLDVSDKSFNLDIESFGTAFASPFGIAYASPISIPNSNHFLIASRESISLIKYEDLKLVKSKTWSANKRMLNRAIRADIHFADRHLLSEAGNVLQIRDLDGNVVKELQGTTRSAIPRSIIPDFFSFDVTPHPLYFRVNHTEFISPTGEVQFSLKRTEKILSWAEDVFLTFRSTKRGNVFAIRDLSNAELLTEFEGPSGGFQLNPRHVPWLSGDGRRVYVTSDDLDVQVYETSSGKLVKEVSFSRPGFAWLFCGIPLWSFIWMKYSLRQGIPAFCDQIIIVAMVSCGLYWRFVAVGFFNDFWRVEWLVVIALLGCSSLCATHWACSKFKGAIKQALPATIILTCSIACAYSWWGPDGTCIVHSKDQWPFQQVMLRFSLATLFLVAGVLITNGVSLRSKHSSSNVSLFDFMFVTSVVAVVYAFLLQLLERHWREATTIQSLLDCLVWAILVSAVLVSTWQLGLMRKKKLLRTLIGLLLLSACYAGYCFWLNQLFVPLNKGIGISKVGRQMLESGVVIACLVISLLWLLLPLKLREFAARNSVSVN